MHLLLNKVKKVVETHPERIAIIDKDGRNCSYNELSKQIDEARKVLQKKGVQKGSKVLVAVPMSIELYAILLALFSMGGIAVFLDPWLKGKQMGQIIKKVQPEVLVIASRLKWIACFLPATWKIKNWWGVKKLRMNAPPSGIKNPWRDNPTPVSNDDIALITFTSGTSGHPKGADRSFGFLAAQLKVLEPHLKGKMICRDFTNFPIVGLADLALGNTVIVPNINLMKIHRANPVQITEYLKRTRANRLIVSPSLLGRTVEGLLKNQNTSDIHSVLTGGAPISYSLVETCLAKFPEIHFEAIFGSTEAEPIAITTFEIIKNNMKNPLKGVFVGRPVNEIICKIIKPLQKQINAAQFEKLICKDGFVGELVVTGEHVNKSYFEDDQAFYENKIIDKQNRIWHRTGDIGYFSENGLYLVGRLSRLMKKGKDFLFPYPVEFFLEREFGLQDTGYVQSENGKFSLCIGGKPFVNIAKIRQALASNNLPIDNIKTINKNLPRDPRHKSKLDVCRLSKMFGL